MDPQEIIAMIMALRTARLALEGSLESELPKVLTRQAELAAGIYFYAQEHGVPEWARLHKNARDAAAEAGKLNHPTPGPQKEAAPDGRDESDKHPAGA